MSGRWQGKSLSFVRQLVQASPNHVSARDAMAHAGPLRGGVPPIGAFAWYDSPPHGNVAVSLGDGRVLGVDFHGWPCMPRYDIEWLGTYVGWSTTLGGQPARS